jgi:ABC-2 type transport system ATP-binding protein
MYVQVDAEGADAGATLSALPGVMRVATAEQRGTVAGFEVESERGTDIRRDIARAVVNRGWGLLELRPMRMSLEEIFLQVTTEELPTEKLDMSGPSDPRTFEPSDPRTFEPSDPRTLGPSDQNHA